MNEKKRVILYTLANVDIPEAEEIIVDLSEETIENLNEDNLLDLLSKLILTEGRKKLGME